MRIVVLGGAGDMGSRAVEDLAASEGVERVTIADRNATAAIEIATRLGSACAKVDTVSLDAGDHAELVKTVSGYDVVASALGPAYVYETQLVRAALEAEVDYASICDEWEPAGSVIDQFDREARDKGITILTGLGTSPGLSNLAVSYYAQHLDKVQRADVYVYQPLNAGGGEAVIQHMLHIISGDAVAWHNGRRVTVPSCSEERTVEFPRFGHVKVWNMGHSEPETIPRFVSGIEQVSFLMGFGRGAGLFIWPAKLGVFGSTRVRRAVGRLVSFLERVSREGEPADGAVRVDIWGESAGKSVHRIACGVGQMREATGISLSIGTQMLGRKELVTEKGGVYAPEACLNARKFIAELNTKGIKAYEDLAMTRELV